MASTKTCLRNLGGTANSSRPLRHQRRCCSISCDEPRTKHRNLAAGKPLAAAIVSYATGGVDPTIKAGVGPVACRVQKAIDKSRSDHR
ncbi:MAG: hypothetical protein ACLTDC_15895 [Lachnospiraceae bacterium]